MDIKFKKLSLRSSRIATLTSLDALSISFIDCQSTSPNPATSELLEVAMDDCVYLLETTKPLSKTIQGLTGIKPEAFKDAISREALFSAIQAQLAAQKPQWIVAHFARFELTLLNRLWQEFASVPFPVPFICTHKLAKRLHPDIPSFGLRAVASWYGDTLHEHKRAKDHVDATRWIWQRMLVELQAQSITDEATLAAFLDEKPKRTSHRKSYLIERDTRLTLPEEPGVYRYIGRNGRILYVGKATSLKHRVNSYFTGGLRRDHRKREMLAQAVDVKITVVPTPLHAGMLEYEEIQIHQPPYNKMFRGDVLSLEDELQPLLKDPLTLDEGDLAHARRHLFYGIDDLNVLRGGLSQWRALYPSTSSWDFRTLIQHGLPLLKIWIAEEKERLLKDAEATPDETEETASDEGEVEDEEEFVWTEELILQAAIAWTRRAARDYIRRRYLKRLRGAVVNTDDGLTYQASPEVDDRQAKVLLHEIRRAAAKGQHWVFVKPWPMHIPFWI